jgi:hypothetical protein
MVSSKDPVKFWLFLVTLMLATAVAVLLLDISIKAAILEESNALRLAIEAERNNRYERRTENPSANGASGNGSHSGDVVDINDAGLEKRDAAKEDTGATKKVVARRPAKPGSARATPEIQG